MLTYTFRIASIPLHELLIWIDAQIEAYSISRKHPDGLRLCSLGRIQQPSPAASMESFIIPSEWVDPFGSIKVAKPEAIIVLVHSESDKSVLQVALKCVDYLFEDVYRELTRQAEMQWLKTPGFSSCGPYEEDTHTSEPISEIAEKKQRFPFSKTHVSRFKMAQAPKILAVWFRNYLEMDWEMKVGTLYPSPERAGFIAQGTDCDPYLYGEGWDLPYPYRMIEKHMPRNVSGYFPYYIVAFEVTLSCNANEYFVAVEGQLFQTDFIPNKRVGLVHALFPTELK